MTVLMPCKVCLVAIAVRVADDGRVPYEIRHRGTGGHDVIVGWPAIFTDTIENRVGSFADLVNSVPMGDT